MMEKDMSQNADGKIRPATARKPYTPPRVVSYGHVKDIVQGGGGKKSDAAGTPPGGRSKGCWIAEELYGVDDPRTWLLRAWVARVYETRSPGWQFAALYGWAGQPTARLIALGCLPRGAFRALFDALLDRALDATAPVVAAARRPGA
jgi:hypothetical protein